MVLFSLPLRPYSGSIAMIWVIDSRLMFPGFYRSLKSTKHSKAKHEGIIAQYDSRSLQQGVITLGEVGEIKNVCDGLFRHALNSRAHRRANGLA
jgi:hypothetical protein